MPAVHTESPSESTPRTAEPQPFSTTRGAPTSCPDVPSSSRNPTPWSSPPVATSTRAAPPSADPAQTARMALTPFWCTRARHSSCAPPAASLAASRHASTWPLVRPSTATAPPASSSTTSSDRIGRLDSPPGSREVSTSSALVAKRGSSRLLPRHSPCPGRSSYETSSPAEVPTTTRWRPNAPDSLAPTNDACTPRTRHELSSPPATDSHRKRTCGGLSAWGPAVTSQHRTERCAPAVTSTHCAGLEPGTVDTLAQRTASGRASLATTSRGCPVCAGRARSLLATLMASASSDKLADEAAVVGAAAGDRAARVNLRAPSSQPVTTKSPRSPAGSQRTVQIALAWKLAPSVARAKMPAWSGDEPRPRQPKRSSPGRTFFASPLVSLVKSEQQASGSAASKTSSASARHLPRRSRMTRYRSVASQTLKSSWSLPATMRWPLVVQRKYCTISTMPVRRTSRTT
mmetsp:Transcript_27018/g.85974  ORF Transcript_27018/g.85974 Transcript_27018/m.85974 type:complete len:460 (+) Transcript_27018:569-1948(+)